MSAYRTHLPQLDGGLFLTDGGLETTLIFLDREELPLFAAFDLMKTIRGKEVLRRYFEIHARIARAHGTGFILESPTWRSSPDWGDKLGYSKEALAAVNRESIELMAEIRNANASSIAPFVISGCVGPRGDGYDPGKIMTRDEAREYHGTQIGIFADSEADMVSAITMTNIPEAIGIAEAAISAGIQSVISFTVETDGRLPTGERLEDAIQAVDEATRSSPAYYMINCAHPTHFERILNGSAPWLKRLRGIRANASKRSHQELNDSADLDDGNPKELGSQYRGLVERLPQLAVLGGCCGTDHRHIDEIGRACTRIKA
jgi:homocysteine S-methyltransferase